MADNNKVGPKRLDVLSGVAESFALGCRRTGAVHRDHIGAETLGSHVEGHASTRAWLKEEVNNRLAAQGGDFLHTAAENFFKRSGSGVNLVNLFKGEFLECDEVAAGPGHRKNNQISLNKVRRRVCSGQEVELDDGFKRG